MPASRAFPQCFAALTLLYATQKRTKVIFSIVQKHFQLCTKSPHASGRRTKNYRTQGRVHRIPAGCPWIPWSWGPKAPRGLQEEFKGAHGAQERRNGPQETQKDSKQSQKRSKGTKSYQNERKKCSKERPRRTPKDPKSSPSKGLPK